MAAGAAEALEHHDFTAITWGYVLMPLAMVTQWLGAACSDPERRACCLRRGGDLPRPGRLGRAPGPAHRGRHRHCSTGPTPLRAPRAPRHAAPSVARLPGSAAAATTAAAGRPARRASAGVAAAAGVTAVAGMAPVAVPTRGRTGVVPRHPPARPAVRRGRPRRRRGRRRSARRLRERKPAPVAALLLVVPHPHDHGHGHRYDHQHGHQEALPAHGPPPRSPGPPWTPQHRALRRGAWGMPARGTPQSGVEEGQSMGARRPRPAPDCPRPSSRTVPHAVVRVGFEQFLRKSGGQIFWYSAAERARATTAHASSGVAASPSMGNRSGRHCA